MSVLRGGSGRFRRAACGAMLLGVLQLTALARAAEPDATDDAQGFRTVEGPDREDVPGVPLLLGAYGLFVLCVSAYALRLYRLQRSTQLRVARLDASLKQRG